MKMTPLLLGTLALVLSAVNPAFSSQIAINKSSGDAVTLLQQGKIRDAIALLERIPPAERSAEIRNNLGYAYYLRSRQYFDGTYAEESFYNRDYEKAKGNLLASQKMAPQRWTVHLNLGDLFFSYNQLPQAASEYKTLLSLNPGYRHAEKIKDRIRLIERETALAKKKGFVPLVAEVHPSLPLRVFRLTTATDEDGTFFDAVDVLVGDDTKVTQSLDCDMVDGGAMYAVDMNFDGYLDLLALSFKGSGHNYGYCSWLYEKKSGSFKTDLDWEREDMELVAPYIDYVRKQIRTTFADSDQNSTDYYRYRQDKLVLEQNITVEFLVDREGQFGRYRRTVKRNVKGKMITQSRKVLSDPKEALSHIWK